MIAILVIAAIIAALLLLYALRRPPPSSLPDSAAELARMASGPRRPPRRAPDPLTTTGWHKRITRRTLAWAWLRWWLWDLFRARRLVEVPITTNLEVTSDPAPWPPPPPPFALLLALLAIALALPACATVPGGHYAYRPPEAIACTLAATDAAIAQLPCDQRKPDPLTCLTAAGRALEALLPCLPQPVWVPDPAPAPKASP